MPCMRCDKESESLHSTKKSRCTKDNSCEPIVGTFSTTYNFDCWVSYDEQLQFTQTIVPSLEHES